MIYEVDKMDSNKNKYKNNQKRIIDSWFSLSNQSLNFKIIKVNCTLISVQIYFSKLFSISRSLQLKMIKYGFLDQIVCCLKF